MKAYLHDRHGNLVFEFGKTWGSNGYKDNCSDILGSRISLWHKTETWDTQSYKVADLDVIAMNGHDLLVKIHHSITSDPIDYSFESNDDFSLI